MKSLGDSGAKAEKLAQDLSKARDDLATAQTRLAQAARDADRANSSDSARIAALEKDLAARTSESEAVSARLASDESALRNAGDSGTRAKELTAELSQLKSELDSANARAAAAQNDSDAAKAQASSRISALEAAVARDAADSKTLSTKLASDDTALKSLGDSGAKAEKLAQDLSKARDDLATAQTRLAQAGRDADRAKSSDSARIAALEKDLAARTSESEAASARLASDESALRRAGDSGSRAKTLATELAQAKRDLAAARDEAAGRARDSETSLADANARASSAAGSLASLTSANKVLQARVASLEESSRASRTAADKATPSSDARAQSLADELERTRRELASTRTNLAAARIAVDLAEKDAANARYHSTEQDAALAARPALAAAVSVAPAMSQPAAGDTGETKALLAELDQTRGDLAIAQGRLADARKAAEDAKAHTSDSSNGREAYDRQLSEVSGRLAATLRMNALLQEEVDRMRQGLPDRSSSAVSAAGAVSAPAPAPAPAARTYTIVEGDTLSKIARRFYGSASRWQAIYDANRGTLRNESSLPVGATLRIP